MLLGPCTLTSGEYDLDRYCSRLRVYSSVHGTPVQFSGESIIVPCGIFYESIAANPSQCSVYESSHYLRLIYRSSTAI